MAAKKNLSEQVGKLSPEASSNSNYHGQKPRFKNSVIRGNKTVVGKQLGAVRYADMYIGGCNKNVVPGDIENYCTSQLKVNVMSCEGLKTKSTRFNSFKVTMTYEDRNKVLDANYWPENVVVRKYTQPRGTSSNQFSSINDVGAKSQINNTNNGM